MIIGLILLIWLKKNVILVDGNDETNKSLFVENNFYDDLTDKIVEYTP
jgi:hypothetical protein